MCAYWPAKKHAAIAHWPKPVPNLNLRLLAEDNRASYANGRHDYHSERWPAMHSVPRQRSMVLCFKRAARLIEAI